MNICKNCINEKLHYHEDYISCEIEVWHCKSCDTLFNVPIEIVRDFDEAEEVTQ
tara:strand:- start:130 stop:291 length:162 start_codon:yes stop_codon:yes gene_type:complete